MKYIKTFSENIEVSQVALGCMRIADMSASEAEKYISQAIELGYNYFDHADITEEESVKRFLARVLHSTNHFVIK